MLCTAPISFILHMRKGGGRSYGILLCNTVYPPPPQFPSFYHSGRGGTLTVLYGICIYICGPSNTVDPVFVLPYSLHFLFSGSVCPADDGTEVCRGESLQSVSGENECEFVDSCTECNDSFEGESGDSWESEPETNDSLYIPTPKRQDKVRPMDLPNKLGFIALPQLGRFLEMVNTIRGCKTPGCMGNLVPVSVDSQGLGGSFSISCYCDGCSLKGAVFETSMKHEGECGSTNAVKMCVQVAFIIAGSTHAVYYKTLKHALGIEAVGEHAFMDTIHYMFPVVKSMLDAICEAAKHIYLWHT